MRLDTFLTPEMGPYAGPCFGAAATWDEKAAGHNTALFSGILFGGFSHRGGLHEAVGCPMHGRCEHSRPPFGSRGLCLKLGPYCGPFLGVVVPSQTACYRWVLTEVRLKNGPHSGDTREPKEPDGTQEWRHDEWQSNVSRQLAFERKFA